MSDGYQSQQQRDVYKARSQNKARIYNNPCRGTIRNEKGEPIPCPRKTGKNSFFCRICFSNIQDYEVN